MIDALYSDPSFNSGEGSINFSGTSKVRLVAGVAAPYEFYALTRLFRLFERTVNVEWGGNSLSLTFTTKDTTSLSLIVADDYLDSLFAGFMPNSEMTDASMLQYRGTYTDEVGTHYLSGHAVVLAEPFQDGYAIVMLMVGDDGTGILEVMWFFSITDVDTTGEPMTVSAADSFETSVAIDAS